MKIFRGKGGTIPATLVALLAILILSIPVARVVAQTSLDSSSSTTCSPSEIVDGINSATSTVNSAAAASVAAPTLESFTTSGYSSTLNSVGGRESFNSSCSVSLTAVVVAYDLTATNGSKYVLEVTLSPTLTVNVGYDLYPATYHGSFDNDTTYAGAEYKDTAGGIGEVSAEWYVPTVTGSGINGQCSGDGVICNYSFWIGEENVTAYGGGNDDIAQTGTDSECIDQSTCSSGVGGDTTYDAWYEFLPLGNVLCTSAGNGGDVTVYGGDQVYGETESASGGGYEAYFIDFTSDTSCSGSASSTSSPAFNMGEAKYAEFMGEVPQREYLPQFSSVSVFDGTYYDLDDDVYYIGSSYNYVYQLQFVTPPGTSFSCDGHTWHIDVCASVPSSSAFTENWESSA